MKTKRVMNFYKIDNHFTQVFSLLYIDINFTRNEITAFPVDNKSFLKLNSKEYF